MEDGRTPKSASIRFTRFNNLSAYLVLAEEGVEVGAVDVDFAAYLREGDEALIAVVLPRLGGDAEDFADFVGLKPVFAGASNPGFLDYLNETVEFLVQ